MKYDSNHLGDQLFYLIIDFLVEFWILVNKLWPVSSSLLSITSFTISVRMILCNDCEFMSNTYSELYIKLKVKGSNVIILVFFIFC